MTPRTVNVVCAKAPRRVGCVPAVRGLTEQGTSRYEVATAVKARPVPCSVSPWRCSFCGARVRVVV